MPRDRVRLLHLARLRLDEVPPVAPLLSTAGRAVVGDCRFRALDNAVAAAIEHHVDFVLLGGQTFHDAARSLRSRVALRRAFHRLDEQGIPVVVMPGCADPLVAWERFPDLPGNVSVLDEGESVVVECDGAPLAQIDGLSSRSTLSEADDGDAPFRIAALLADAVLRGEAPAKGRRERRQGRASSLASAFEILSSAELHGASLPEDPAHGELARLPWDFAAVSGFAGPSENLVGMVRAAGEDWEYLREEAHGSPRRSPFQNIGEGRLITLRQGRGAECESLPISPVVAEAATITVGVRDSEDDVVARMRDVLRRHRPSVSETCLLMRWTLRGSGPLFLALADPEYQQLLADAVDDEAARKSLQLGHAFHLHSTRFDTAGRALMPYAVPRPAVWGGRDAHELEAAGGHDDSGHGLPSREGEERLPSLIEQAADALSALLAAEVNADDPEVLSAFVRNAVAEAGESLDARLEDRLARLDAAAVAGEAARWIEAWLEGAATRRDS